jgi:hypothetical protein
MKPLPFYVDSNMVLDRLFVKRIVSLLAFGGVLGLSLNARAQEENLGTHLAVGLGVQYNDNVYGSSTLPVSDVITAETLGFSTKGVYGKQSFNLDGTVTNNDYASNKRLNYVTSNVAAGWAFEIGSSLSGGIKATHAITLTPYGMSVNTSSSNLMTTLNDDAYLGYALGPGWQLVTGVANSSVDFGQAVVGQTSSQYSGSYLGINHYFGNNNSVLVTMQNATGHNAYDYSIHSSEIQINLRGDDTPSISCQIGYWKQSYDHDRLYNFSGVQGGLSVTWPFTLKTSGQISYLRKLVGNPIANSSYSIVDTLSIGPSWDVTSKINLKAQYQDIATRAMGDPGGGASNEVDTVRLGQLTLSWHPRDELSMLASYSRTYRTSTVASDISQNVFSIAATYTF